jgi:hypothetical protein
MRQLRYPQLPSAWQRWPPAHVVAPQWHVPPAHVPALPASQSPSPLHTHAEPVHANPVGHARPQAPQSDASVVRSKQPAGVSQHVCPVEQPGTLLQAQAPFRQNSPR